MNGSETRQWSVMASSRLYSGQSVGYSVPTVNTTLYIVSNIRNRQTSVYQAEGV